ncbi:MAG: prepilin-type N-terminal cleavage/methylation domain-containing protein [Bacteroidia bacterium]|nr:prepilin-type N-terminal cleavage/methylation domain-containing protein [Bacteroidia bacterium]
MEENVMKKNNEKGFTLAELLIVVAIIAVLVAISIPIFSTQLEKSRDAVTAANLRSAYAEAAVEVLTGDISVSSSAMTVTKDVDVKGTVDDGITSGFDFPFSQGSNFSLFGNKSNSMTKAVFTWSVDASGNIDDQPTVTASN